jgi:TolB-like protein
MSFIAELKRRNVFRVGAAYGIVAWLLVEVASVVLPTFDAPEWVMKVVTFLVILGFPLAVILAWAFELTPEGIKRDSAVDSADSSTHVTGRRLDFILIGLLAVSVGYFAVDKFVLEGEPKQGAVTAERRSAAEPVATERSIAVLPFVNMSSDPEQEYFSDGLSEEILNLLAKIPDLKVIGRTSSFAFKGKNEDLRGIGEALDVNTVLEGSVRKSGDRIRVTAQLIDVLDGAHIWSETYDRTMTDIFAVQDSVASAIIDALQIHVGAAPTRGRPTENTEAYSLFLKARAAMNTFDLPDAEKLLLKTIELDAEFAEAHELLAYCYWWQSGVMVEAVGGQERMRDAALRALELDPSLLFARAFVSGSTAVGYYLAELEALERVTLEQPNNSGAREALIYDLLAAGYFREALTTAERFVELDPLSAPAHFRLSQALAAVGRWDEATQSSEFASELGARMADWNLGFIALLGHRYEAAIAHLEVFQGQYGESTAWVRETVAGARNPETGQAYLDEHLPQIVASVPEERALNTQLALIDFYLAFGFLDRYFDLIFSFDLNSSQWSDADILIFRGMITPSSGFTAHPRFLEVAKAYGLLDVWEQRGSPDFCEKIGGEWVCE